MAGGQCIGCGKETSWRKWGEGGSPGGECTLQTSLILVSYGDISQWYAIECPDLGCPLVEEQLCYGPHWDEKDLYLSERRKCEVIHGAARGQAG